MYYFYSVRFIKVFSFLLHDSAVTCHIIFYKMWLYSVRYMAENNHIKITIFSGV